MQVEWIGLENFRNLEPLHLQLPTGKLALVGPNGQGKSNFLEALSLLSFGHSFRTRQSRNLIREGAGTARLFWKIRTQEEPGNPSEVLLQLEGQKRKLSIDNQWMRRLGEFVGKFPVVTCSQEDRLLLRGPPGSRRVYLDSLLSTLRPGYFDALVTYQRALKQRNASLKQASTAQPALLRSFEIKMAESGHRLVRERNEMVAELKTIFAETYLAFAEKTERPDLRYKPDVEAASVQDLVNRWEKDRNRDLILQTTRHGPHRDSMEIFLQGHPAGNFGSDGQQRGLVLALRLAELSLLRIHHTTRPLFLLDDVLNELDAYRREAFWAMMDEPSQIVATGTERPAGKGWALWTVSQGKISSEL